MDTPKIFESEYRFCLILWDHEPINSTQLAALCKSELGWSKTTTYTVIRRLSDRGVIKSENAIVSAIVTKEQVQSARLNEVMEDTFQGSLPAFLAAFSKNRKLSQREAQQLQDLLDSFPTEEESL